MIFAFEAGASGQWSLGVTLLDGPLTCGFVLMMHLMNH
jgi:hypothetical protein